MLIINELFQKVIEIIITIHCYRHLLEKSLNLLHINDICIFV